MCEPSTCTWIGLGLLVFFAALGAAIGGVLVARARRKAIRILKHVDELATVLGSVMKGREPANSDCTSGKNGGNADGQA